MIDIENNIIIHHLLSGFKFSHSIKRRPVSSSKFLTTNLHFLRMTSSSHSLSLWSLLYLLAKFPLTTPLATGKNTKFFLKVVQNYFASDSIIPEEWSEIKGEASPGSSYLSIGPNLLDDDDRGDFQHSGQNSWFVQGSTPFWKWF